MKHVSENLFPLQLCHQAGAAGDVVIKHHCGFTRLLATSDGHIQVGIRHFQCIRRTQQDCIGDGICIPLFMQPRKL